MSIGLPLSFYTFSDNTNELESVRKELIEEDNAGSNESVEVTVGGEVQLECPSGPSTAIPCWAKTGNDNELQPIGPSSNLHIDQVLYQEAGEYKCIVGSKNQNLEKLRVYTLHLNVVGQYLFYYYCMPSNTTFLSFKNKYVLFLRLSLSLNLK